MLKSIMELLGVSRKKGLSTIKDLSKKISGMPFLDGFLDTGHSNYLIFDHSEKLLTAQLISALREQGDTVMVVDYDAQLMKLAGIATPGDADLVFNFKDKRFLAWNPLTCFKSEWDIPRIVKLVVQHLDLEQYDLAEQVETFLKKILGHLISEKTPQEQRWPVVYTLMFKAPVEVLSAELEVSENEPFLKNIEAVRRALFNFDDYNLFHSDKDPVYLEDAISFNYPGVIYFPLLSTSEEVSKYFIRLGLDSLLFSIQNEAVESEHKFWLIMSTGGETLKLTNLRSCLKSAEQHNFCMVEVQMDPAEKAPHLPHDLVDEVFFTRTNISVTYVNENTERTVLEPGKVKEELATLKATEYLRLYQNVLYRGLMSPINPTGFKRFLPKDQFGNKIPKLERYLMPKEKPAVGGRSLPSDYVPPAQLHDPTGALPDDTGEAVVLPPVVAAVPRTRFELPSSKRNKQQEFAKQNSAIVKEVGILR